MKRMTGISLAGLAALAAHAVTLEVPRLSIGVKLRVCHKITVARNRLVTGVCENGAFQMKTWRKVGNGDALVPVGRRDTFVPPSAVPRLAVRPPCAAFQNRGWGHPRSQSLRTRYAQTSHPRHQPITKKRFEKGPGA